MALDQGKATRATDHRSRPIGQDSRLEVFMVLSRPHHRRNDANKSLWNGGRRLPCRCCMLQRFRFSLGGNEQYGSGHIGTGTNLRGTSNDLRGTSNDLRGTSNDVR